MPDDIVDMVDDRYRKLKDDEPVHYDVASMFCSENNGFMMKVNGGDEAVGFIQEGTAIKIFVYDLFKSGGDPMVEEKHAFGIVVDNRTEHDLSYLIKKAGHEPIPVADDNDEDTEQKNLDYLG